MLNFFKDDDMKTSVEELTKMIDSLYDSLDRLHKKQNEEAQALQELADEIRKIACQQDSCVLNQLIDSHVDNVIENEKQGEGDEDE